MQWYIDLFIILMFMALVFTLLKRRRLREIQFMFRRYNESGDIGVITAWIAEKQEARRMEDTLDYLWKIEEPDLAWRVFSAFEPDRFKGRHTRIFAARHLPAEAGKAKP